LVHFLIFKLGTGYPKNFNAARRRYGTGCSKWKDK